MAAWCCSVCACASSALGSGWEQPRRWLSFCSGTEIFCVWVVAEGGCWALALGFIFFFFPLQNAFSSFNTRWFGASPASAKPSRESALVSARSGIEAVAGEGSVSYGAFVQL